MKRTLSIGSRVPPAVTSTRSPRHELVGGSARRRGSLSQTSSSRAGSGRRPTPSSPSEARRPRSGSTTLTPRARSVSRLVCTAGCSYMWLFIAGATTSGQVAASAALQRRLSARPWASLAIVFAEAGAIR